jgi:predicted kinase
VKQFLLQVTGESGTGKSTLAKAIGRETGAVVIDKDVIKSRMLDGDPEMGLDGLPESIAARLHHAMMFDLARFLLGQGLSVVLDGAAFYPIVRQRGHAAAEAFSASYFIIECACPDLNILQARIDSKALMSSQPRVASLRGYELPGHAPLTEPHLQLDTRRPFEEYLAEGLAYVRNSPGEP